MKRLLFLLALPCTLSAFAQPTHLVIKVKAKDASILGYQHAGKYGAVFVTIKDAQTGKLYASGLLAGDPGDSAFVRTATPQINPADGKPVHKNGRFETVIDIKEPTLVTAEIIAPTKKRNAAASTGAGFSYARSEAVVASTQIWLIPGKNIDGDGEVIEIPGFLLDIQDPLAGRSIRLDTLTGNNLTVNVSLTMLCGCKITKGGKWNSENIDVAGYLKRDGIKLQQADFQLSDTSRYQGVFNIREKGNYEVVVTAYDRVSKNTGVDKAAFKVD
jgi:hypothetical protein